MLVHYACLSLALVCVALATAEVDPAEERLQERDAALAQLTEYLNAGLVVDLHSARAAVETVSQHDLDAYDQYIDRLKSLRLVSRRAGDTVLESLVDGYIEQARALVTMANLRKRVAGRELERLNDGITEIETAIQALMDEIRESYYDVGLCPSDPSQMVQCLTSGVSRGECQAVGCCYSDTQGCFYSNNQACSDLSADLPSGSYYMDLNGGDTSDSVLVYCDMETDGGGWTLVWSYEFTDPGHFLSGSNAVTPCPDFPLSSRDSPENIPSNPNQPGLVAFEKWQTIGDEVLFSSTFNNLMKCLPDVGNFVTASEGLLDCTILEQHFTDCLNGSPAYEQDIQIISSFLHGQNYLYFGPNYNGNNIVSFFECDTANVNFPAQNPCGHDLRHFPQESELRGAVYVRRTPQA